MSSQEVTVELLLGDGSNYKSWSVSIYKAFMIVDSVLRSAYFAIMSSDSDLFVDAHDLWNRIKEKYSVTNCDAPTPYITCVTNHSEGEEQERWHPNDESTSSTGLFSTSDKCFIA